MPSGIEPSAMQPETSSPLSSAGVHSDISKYMGETLSAKARLDGNPGTEVLPFMQPSKSYDDQVVADTLSAMADSASPTIKNTLKSIQELGDKLFERFHEAPGLGYIPLAGHVLAYVLAAAGVAYLMHEAIPGLRKQQQNNETETPPKAEADETMTGFTYLDSRNKIPVAPEILKGEHNSPFFETESGIVLQSTLHGSGTEVSHAGYAHQAIESQEQCISLDDASNPVLPWMDDDPAGWGPAENQEIQTRTFNALMLNPELVPVVQNDSPPKVTMFKHEVDPAFRSFRAPNAVAQMENDRVNELDVLSARRLASATELCTKRSDLKDKLWWVIRGLGPTASIVPGGEPVRADIDELITKLEEITPLETPLNTQADADVYAYLSSRSKAHPYLLGMWRLEYTSNTQVLLWIFFMCSPTTVCHSVSPKCTLVSGSSAECDTASAADSRSNTRFWCRCCHAAAQS